MDSKLEAHIDEIFQDVPKTDKMVTMINRIKSKANSKYLQTREQGYSRSVAFNEVDDWLMKAKVIVDEEAGKLTPAEIAAAPMVAPAYVDENEPATPSYDDEPVVEKTEEPAPFAAFGGNEEASFSFSSVEEPAPETPVEEAPVDEAPIEEEGGKKKKKKEKKEKGEKKSKKPKKEEIEEEEIIVPVHPIDKKGKIIGGVLLVAGVALLLVASLMIVGIIH